MKRIGILLVLISLGLFTVGCQKPAETPPAEETTPAAEAPADDAAAPADAPAAAPAETPAPAADANATE